MNQTDQLDKHYAETAFRADAIPRQSSPGAPTTR